jgi:tRNA dimethylallyltransferase
VPPGELPPLIVICGPTATGKTALSLDVAERIPGAEIISADSRQVYRGMDIGTAKVSQVDQARVPHHGLDLVDPDESFTAADFRRHAMAALTGIAGRGGVALLVGGTGLYLRSVARGVAVDQTGSDPAARRDLEVRLAQEGLSPLVDELKTQAPKVASSVDLANPRRVVRALERVRVFGDVPPPLPTGYAGMSIWIGLLVEPDVHARWITQRARSQFANGLLDEAAELRTRHPEDLPAFSALGYREAFDVLAGRSNEEQAIHRTITRTRAYARRQRTWFRAEPNVNWVPAGDGVQPVAGPIVAAFLGSARRPRRSGHRPILDS